MPFKLLCPNYKIGKFWLAANSPSCVGKWIYFTCIDTLESYTQNPRNSSVVWSNSRLVLMLNKTCIYPDHTSVIKSQLHAIYLGISIEMPLEDKLLRSWSEHPNWPVKLFNQKSQGKNKRQDNFVKGFCSDDMSSFTKGSLGRCVTFPIVSKLQEMADSCGLIQKERESNVNRLMDS